MANRQKMLEKRRLRRRRTVRKKVRGSADRPRLSVFRSNKHIAAQLIDDVTGVTLASATTRDGTLSGQVNYGGNCDAAVIVGTALAEKALAAGIKAVRFDRGHNKYHGRVAALADAVREAGVTL
jgi:large subunit ribosomal protein L18